MSRFVRPETETLPISNGDTVIVRKRLNTGESRARFARMSLAGVDGGLKVNRLQIGMATVTAYLLDWSLKGLDGKPVVIHDKTTDPNDVNALTSVLDNLDPEDFGEIREAIEAHEQKMNAAREAEKNGQDGANKSPAISPSPLSAAGATSGSPN